HLVANASAPPASLITLDRAQRGVLVGRERARLRGGAADHDAVGTLRDLVLDQPGERLVVHGAVLERRDQGRIRPPQEGAVQVHRALLRTSPRLCGWSRTPCATPAGAAGAGGPRARGGSASTGSKVG